MSTGTKFNPNAPDGDAIVAGDYLIGGSYFQRKTSKAGNIYLRVKYEIIEGPYTDGGQSPVKTPGQAAKTFFSSLGLDLGNSGVRGRLRVLSKCVGYEEEFDVASDAQMYDFMVGKGFRCTLKVNESNGYVNHDIDRYYPKVNDEQAKAIEIWQLDYKIEPNMKRPFEEDDPFDDPEGGPKDGYEGQRQGSEDDNSIPF